jgi:tRNA/rRNA methyltransferase
MPMPPPGAPTDRPSRPPRATALSTASLVLVRTEGAINLGQIARLCGNLGIDDLRLVAPRCDAAGEEARTFATRHGQPLLARAGTHATLAEAVADCGLVVGTSGEFRRSAFGEPLRAQEIPALLARRPARRWAFVFGAESDGLSDDELALCQACVHLDTFGPNHSYNLAAAVAIAGHLVAGAAEPPATSTPPAAPRAEIDALERHCLATLRRLGYPRARDAARYAPHLRRFLGRLHLATEDARALRGMLTLVNRVAFGSDERG